MMDVFWWNQQKNFGDAISPVIVSYVSGKKAQYVEPETPGKLLACGSIIQYAQENDTIWGSGIHPTHAEPLNFLARRPSQLNIIAVRGPISRDILMNDGYSCPAIYGDPALLAPLVYPDVKHKKMFDFGVVPHLDQKKFYPDNCRLMNVRDEPIKVIEEMLTCRVIISASLHGIICAEAYGIPAIWLKCKQGRIKYDDYYASTNRTAEPIATLAEAIKATPPPLPDLRCITERLLASFRLVS